MITNANHAPRTDRESLATASTLAMTLAILASATPAAAQTTSDGAVGNAASASTVKESGAGLEEIVVTAQRRSERITDVPYNISAVTASDLAASGATNANDLTKMVAGLGNFADGPVDRVGENNFTLRGLRTDNVGPNLGPKYTVSSVATYYGDTPVFFPILLKDLERVEVLRGPQGTLYGSGAQAGAIRFIPKRPSFEGTSGELNASTGYTQSADRPNGSFDGVVNLPLADNLAVRLSGAHVNQAGFIDQVGLFQLDANGVPVPSVPGDLTSGPVLAPVEKNTNSWEQSMGRAAVRYQPSDWLDLEANYLHQNTRVDDAQASNPEYLGGERDLSSGSWPDAPYQTRPGGRYENTQSMTQPIEAKLDLISGTATADLGFAELTSASSYYENTTDSRYDGGFVYVNPVFNFVAGYNHYPRFIGDIRFAGKDRGFTQELRLVSKAESKLTYVAGAYYQKHKRDLDFVFYAPGINAFGEAAGTPSANPQLTDVIFGANQKFRTTEKAAFGELTYHITDRWQVTGGARVFDTSQDFANFQVYPFFGAPYGDGVTEPIAQGASALANSASADGEVYKLNSSYSLNSDNKVYVTYSEGFRRGGANPISSTGPTASLPKYLSFQPDYAYNYEVGIKGIVLDRRLSYAVSAYQIDQKDFQFNGLTPAFYTAVFNGETARSRGVELEGSFKATANLTLSGSYAFTDTDVPKTTDIFDYRARTLIDDPEPVIILNPNATVPAGAVLPGVSRHSVIAAIDYEIPLAGQSSILLHANSSYRSKQNNMIATVSPNFAELPSAFMADARVTYDTGRGWSGTLFVTNLTNETAYSGTQGAQTQDVAEPQALIYAGKLVAQPRTYGLSLHYDF